MNTRPLSFSLLALLIVPFLLGHVGVALAGAPGTAKYDFRVSDMPTVGLRSPALDRDNTMYVGGDDGHVYAINPDGTMKWTYNAGSPVTTNAAIYYSPDNANPQYNGTIYVGLEDGRVLALGQAGNLKWAFPAGTPINASPALAADGTIYVGKEPSVLVAINPDGSHRWSRTLPGNEGIHDPVVGPDGTIYFGTRGHQYFYAYDSDGAIKWATHILGGIHSAAAIGRDGSLYFSRGFSLNALWPNGNQKWEFNLGLDNWLTAPPVIGHQGTIYVSADALIAISPAGTWEWDFWHDGEWPRIICSAAVDSSGLIYAPGFDGYIYCIAPGGTFVWRYYAGGAWLTAPLVGSDGLLYSADYCEVRALYTGATGPFDSAWPMYRGDAQCTARLDKYWSMLSRLKNLLVLVARADLNERVKERLVVRLNSAMRSLEAGRIWPAIHKLGAFIHYVEAQDGKKIPEELADLLIRDALDILMLADGGHPWSGPCWRRWDWGRTHHRFASGCRHQSKHVGRFRWRHCDN